MTDKSPESAPPRRKSLRLPVFDYSTPGAYFITIVTRGRELLFGDIEDDAPALNSAGAGVQASWLALPARFESVDLDEFVVMPNHMHGILWLLDSRANEEGAASSAPTLAQAGLPAPPTLSVVVRAFKSTSALAVNRTLGRSGAVWHVASSIGSSAISAN